MKTYKFLFIHIDRDSEDCGWFSDGCGWFYIEDHIVFSHGYATSLRAAVFNWVKHIPEALSIKRMERLALASAKDEKHRQEYKIN